MVSLWCGAVLEEKQRCTNYQTTPRSSPAQLRWKDSVNTRTLQDIHRPFIMQIRSNSTEGQQQTGPATSLLKCIATGDGTNQNINKNPSYHNRQIRLFKKCAFLTASFLLLCLESMTLWGKNELKVTVWKITSF